MKLTSKEIMDLSKYFNELANKELDFNTACIVASNINNLAKPVEIANKELNRLGSEYADRDENGGYIPADNGGFMLKADTANEYYQKINDLFASETDIDIKAITKKSLSEIKVSPNLIIALGEKDLLIDDEVKEA